MGEKNGVIHIIFIFLGICLICLGTFYFFTDNNTSLNNEEKKEPVKVEDKDTVKQISLMKDVDTSITLKNKKEIRIRFSIDEETSKGSFFLNNNLVFQTSSALEQCDEFYLYNNSVVSYCYYGPATSGYLYVINSANDYFKVETFKDKNYEYYPENIQLKNDKLIINASRVYEGAEVMIGDKKVSLCYKEEIIDNNIDVKEPAYTDFELVINNNRAQFVYINTVKTLEQIINEYCKTVD